MKNLNLNSVGVEAMAHADDEIKRTPLVVVKGTMTIHAVFWDKQFYCYNEEDVWLLQQVFF